jgi:hypothetical protein
MGLHHETQEMKMVNEARSPDARRTGATQADAPDTATQASSVMKQFSKTDHEIDPDGVGLPEPPAQGDTGDASVEPDLHKPRRPIDRPGTLTPHAGSPMEKVPSDGGAPER